MIAEIGLFALILALFVAAIQSVFSLLGASRGTASQIRLGSWAAAAQFALVTLALAMLVWQDAIGGSSLLVPHNGADKPLLKILTAWRSREGVAVLSTLILALYAMAVFAFGRTLQPGLRARVLSVQGIMAFILLLVLTTSRPFERVTPPNLTTTVLIDKAAPSFNLSPLYAGGRGFTTADLRGQITLVNYFASWCVPCRAEQPVLRSLAGRGMLLVGIDYKDNPENARAFLAKLGNPYRMIAADTNGRAATDFGVYGVPETYLIDKNGIIRYRQAGPLTDDIVRKEILPLAERLKRSSPAM